MLQPANYHDDSMRARHIGRAGKFVPLSRLIHTRRKRIEAANQIPIDRVVRNRAPVRNRVPAPTTVRKRSCSNKP